MTNKIKAEVWDFKEKKMYEAVSIPTNREVLWSPLIIENGLVNGITQNDYTIRYEIGIKDLKGREIYTGDIVINKDNGTVGYIAYLKQELGCVLVLKNRDVRIGHRAGRENFEVIGNVYENPDLLDRWDEIETC